MGVAGTETAATATGAAGMEVDSDLSAQHQVWASG
jgi:hypothetical protein